MAEKASKTRWNGRRFTTFLLLFSFLSVVVSGVFCYVKPKGAVAHWTGWSLLGLTKEGWEGTHMSLSLLFLCAAGLHLFFNWKPFAHYFRNSFSFKGSGPWEALLPLCLVVLFWAGTLADVPPVSLVPEGHSYFKKKVWAGGGFPPVPWDGAEKTALGELALDYGLSFPVFRKKLEASGFTPRGSEETLKKLARRYEVSPAEVVLRALGPVKGLKPAYLLQRLKKDAEAE